MEGRLYAFERTQSSAVTPDRKRRHQANHQKAKKRRLKLEPVTFVVPEKIKQFAV